MIREALNIPAVAALLDEAPALIAVLRGPNHVFEFANRLFLESVGRTAEQIIDHPIREALNEPERQGTYERMDRAFQTGESVRLMETQSMLYSNGRNNPPEEKYFNAVYIPLKQDDAITGVLLHATDITANVKQQKALQLSKTELQYAEEKLRDAIEAANLGSWERDLAGRSGLMDGSLPGNEVHTAGKFCLQELIEISPQKEEVIAQIQRAMQDMENCSFDAEFESHQKDSEENRRFQVRGKVFFDENNRPARLTGITRDVTVQRFTEQRLSERINEKTAELAGVNEDLRRLNANLEQFVYIASHDLQEPLRKVNVFADMLERSSADLNEEGQIYLVKIKKAAARMSTLINDLLEFSRIGSKEKVFVPIDLNKVIQNVITDYELLIRQKNAEVKVESLPVIEAIPLQMNQLFFNLIGNALKFAGDNQRPDVSISCRMADPAEIRALKLKPSLSYCNISVRDNGIGFDQQYADQIFELFRRLHGKHEYAGTGIGLSLAKKIADNHDGTITAQSADGDGATFNVFLPIARNLNI